MIETIIVPTKVEESTARGNPCLVITYSDKGKEYTKRIFEPSWYDLFAPNKPTKIQLAKQGNYWNIVGVESIQDKIQEVPQPIKKPVEREGKQVKHEEKPSQEMLKEDWAERDRVTRKSIERQKSLEMAVEVAKVKGSDSAEKIIATAKVFEAYLEGIKTGGVTAKSRLVEEAMKMGKEIEEGG